MQKSLKLLAVQPFSGFSSMGILALPDSSAPVFFTNPT
jgi:hypothetical protein